MTTPTPRTDALKAKIDAELTLLHETGEGMIEPVEQALDALADCERDLAAAREAIRYLVDHQGHFQTKHAPAIDAAMRKP